MTRKSKPQGNFSNLAEQTDALLNQAIAFGMRPDEIKMKWQHLLKELTDNG